MHVKIANSLKALEAGDLYIVDLLRNPPPEIGRVRLWVLLTRTPRLGEIGAKRVCEAANVWPLTRIDTIDDSQREALIECLPARVLIP